jgi:hypothetical protein
LKGDDLQKSELSLRSFKEAKNQAKVDEIINSLTAKYPGLKIALSSFKEVNLT